MKVAFFYGKQPQSFLAWLFTRSSCYHVGFTDESRLWDMNWIRRRRIWNPSVPMQEILVDCPVPVPVTFLEIQLETDGSHYGVLDYLAFVLRRFFRRLRFNGKGLICSEMVLNDLKACGWEPPAWMPEVPSPGDLELALLGTRNAIAGFELRVQD